MEKFFYTYEHGTAKAILCNLYSFDRIQAYGKHWLPSSQCKFDAKAGVVQMPVWLAKSKGLPYTAIPAASETATPVAEVKATTKVKPGIYTVTFESGDYRTLRVSAKGFKNDDTCNIVSYLCGSDNENSYAGFAHIDANGTLKIWKKFAGNTMLRDAAQTLLMGDDNARSEFGKAYARQSGNCFVCNRTLTTPESLDRGIGPECAKKGF